LILVSPAGIPLPSPEVSPRRTGYLWKFISSLWNWNFTPQLFIRSLGPAGPRLVRGYATRRFAHLEQAEIDALDSYIYHISAQRGSGEFALNRLLLPGAIARKPLHERLPNLKMPVTFMYGNEDWMVF
jgi:pimeloyl-ACP methyl ester carboxylesterase